MSWVNARFDEPIPFKVVPHVGGNHEGDQEVHLVALGLPDVILYRTSLDELMEHYDFDPIAERYVYAGLVERKPMKRTYFNDDGSPRL